MGDSSQEMVIMSFMLHLREYNLLSNTIRVIGIYCEDLNNKMENKMS